MLKLEVEVVAILIEAPSMGGLELECGEPAAVQVEKEEVIVVVVFEV